MKFKIIKNPNIYPMYFLIFIIFKYITSYKHKIDYILFIY